MILHDNLLVRKLFSFWIPHKQARFKGAREMLKKNNESWIRLKYTAIECMDVSKGT